MSRHVLGIDGHRLVGARTGVGRYLAELLRAWASTAVPFDDVLVYLPPGAQTDVPFTARPVPERIGRSAWFHWTLGRVASREVDLLFCPSYAAPFVYRGRLVVTVHDALTALMPPERGVRQRLRHEAIARSARRADRVVTVSETSKRDIERLYGVPAVRVVVVPNGCSEEFYESPTVGEIDAVRRAYGLDNLPFCLFVGKFARRRNLPVLVEAFAAARRRVGSQHILVLAGDNPLGEPVAEAATSSRIADAVRIPGHVPDSDLRALYHATDLFVYPSQYEGFGLPVLEAMASGAPVLTVRNSSLAEVADDAAFLVTEPTRAALEDGLVTLLGDEALRRHYAELGRARARLFSWRRTAEETMAVLTAASAGAE
jgi:glycosyltransferase involved in cell wall biosynthesis